MIAKIFSDSAREESILTAPLRSLALYFAVQFVAGFVENEENYAAEEYAHTRGLLHEEQGCAGQNNAAGDDEVLYRMNLFEIVFHFFIILVK